MFNLRKDVASERVAALNAILPTIPADVWAKESATITLRYEVLESDNVPEEVAPRLIIAWGRVMKESKGE